MTRVDVRVSCDACGETLAETQSYATIPKTDKEANLQSAALTSLVYRAVWEAVRKGATVTATSCHCASCRKGKPS